MTPPPHLVKLLALLCEGGAPAPLPAFKAESATWRPPWWLHWCQVHEVGWAGDGACWAQGANGMRC